jgi:outer membrane protein assembly factor BamB
MKTSWLSITVPGLVAVVGVAALAGWLSVDNSRPIDARVPGLDGTPPPSPDEIREPPQPGDPVRLDGQPASIAGSWPWFRGPKQDAISHEKMRLARSWPAAGPPVLWTIEMGDGHAGPVIADGCVYVLDYDETAEADTMRCLSLADGRDIWRNSYPVEVAWSHGMSRTVSAVVGPHVISLGPRCHVACWDKETGHCVWLMDLMYEYGVTVPRWYAGQCPLVDGDRVILAPASPKALMVAVEIATGQPVWTTPNKDGWGMTHSSVVPVEYAGCRMYVYCATKGVVGVSAENGKILWKCKDWKQNVALAPSPVDLGDGRLLLSSGYNKDGSLFLQLGERDGQYTATVVKRLTPSQFNSEQQTPILYNDRLFGIRKSGGGQFVCMDLEGNEVYNSGTDKFGDGPYMIADGLVFLLSEKGMLTMADASPQEYRPLGQFQVFEKGHDAWGPMALVAGHLIVRDLNRMTCLDVAKRE